MILAQKLDSEVDLGFVGDIKKLTTKPIVDALNNGYVPIIPQLALARTDSLTISMLTLRRRESLLV